MQVLLRQSFDGLDWHRPEERLRQPNPRHKPKSRPMPEAARRAHNIKSKVRSSVEHVFAEQKSPMELFIRTIGIARATTTKIGMANILCSMKRPIYLDRVAIA
jgi:transposase, IS5 family